KTLEINQFFPEIGEKHLMLNAIQMHQEDVKKDRILLTINDITQWKKAVEDLEESRERLHLLVQNSFDIITIFSPDGTIKYLSPSVQQVLGYDPDKDASLNFLTGPMVHPDDLNEKDRLIQMCLEKPHRDIRGELRLKHKDDTYHIMDVIMTNLMGDKRIQGIIANYRDITERRKLEQQKDEFIGIASHELRTPLTSIKAYTEILQEQFQERNDIDSKNMAEKMDRQVDRLTRLISDLLDVTKITGGQLMLHDDEFDLNELVREIVEEIQVVTKQHKIEMKLQPSVQLHGDRGRTGQVLTNLLSNAIKYSPEQKHVLVSTDTSARDHATICVQDFGIGMPANMEQKVFERFFRINGVTGNSFPGMGLGLYIAAEIVKRQKGKIWVESNEGEGSVFCFSLPLTGD
ncbi:MAG TPA: PAS domain-containing sensor histidine kinase, partial [Chitinophagaceae bacterium]|nr:PAS domain-containing sensor histidine kinase [Chitinophagaceae bacterium]